MSGLAQPVVVIRLVRVRGSEASPTERGVVAAVCEGQLDTEGDGDAGASYLILPRERALTRTGAARQTAADVRVGDVVVWVGEPYGALWVADRAPAAPRPDPPASDGDRVGPLGLVR